MQYINPSETALIRTSLPNFNILDKKLEDIPQLL